MDPHTYYNLVYQLKEVMFAYTGILVIWMKFTFNCCVRCLTLSTARYHPASLSSLSLFLFSSTLHLPPPPAGQIRDRAQVLNQQHHRCHCLGGKTREGPCRARRLRSHCRLLSLCPVPLRTPSPQTHPLMPWSHPLVSHVTWCAAEQVTCACIWRHENYTSTFSYVNK